MISFLETCDKGLNFLLRSLVLLTSAVIAIALVVLVISRYFFNISISGMHETSLFAAMWLYMCGAILASRRKEHLVVDFLATSLKTPRAWALHEIVISVLILIITVFFAHWVYSMFAWGLKRPQIIPVLNVPLWWSQAPMALVPVCGFAYALRDLLRAIARLKEAS